MMHFWDFYLMVALLLTFFGQEPICVKYAARCFLWLPIGVYEWWKERNKE